MKNTFLILFTAVVSVFTINYLVFAWNEPTADPPNDNVAAPLNVGFGRQTKSGDITLNNLKATSITLGEDTRFAWPGGIGASCNWEGVKCSCKTDGWDAPRGFITIGSKCLSGIYTGTDVVDFGISNIASIGCPSNAPAECNAGYTRR